jgi:hypothetical protein
MSEHQLWTRVRDALKDVTDLKIDLCRVENMVQAGTPDVNYCYNGVEGWIELKHADKPPARDSTPVFPDGKGLRDEQVIWIHKRARAGGRVWILARCGESIFLVNGAYAKVFNTMTYPQLIEHCSWWTAKKRGVDWEGLVDILIG